MIKLKSNNGWDPLKSIVVGDASGARIPPLSRSMKNFMFANLEDHEIREKCRPWTYSTKVIDESQEDLEILADTLKKESVTVYRPEMKNYGWMNYCPRDIFLVLDDILLETPNVMSIREYESLAYRHILNKLDGRWLKAPVPQYLEESFDFSDLSSPTLMNAEIMFDAPNVVSIQVLPTPDGATTTPNSPGPNPPSIKSFTGFQSVGTVSLFTSSIRESKSSL